MTTVAPARLVIVDESLKDATGTFVAGANARDKHMKGVRIDRDAHVDAFAPIATAVEGDPCPNCGSSLAIRRAIEVANIFQLRTKYSEALDAYFTDAKGERKPLIMGSYGIGIGRLLACLAEEYHDDDGLCLPAIVAPFDVHILALKVGDELARAVAEQCMSELDRLGATVLYDDREVGAGVKFADADLIGTPIRIVVSDKSIAAGGVEVSERASKQQAHRENRGSRLSLGTFSLQQMSLTDSVHGPY
jgi:prolyl-tRNA synthetase